MKLLPKYHIFGNRQATRMIACLKWKDAKYLIKLAILRKEIQFGIIEKRKKNIKTDVHYRTLADQIVSRTNFGKSIFNFPA